jgi:hypothetical protein
MKRAACAAPVNYFFFAFFFALRFLAIGSPSKVKVKHLSAPSMPAECSHRD